jgi:hypothetical protein
MGVLMDAIGGTGEVIVGLALSIGAVRASLIPRDSPRRPWVALRRSASLRVIYPFMARNPRWFLTEAGFGTATALAGVAVALRGLRPRSHVLWWFFIPMAHDHEAFCGR